MVRLYCDLHRISALVCLLTSSSRTREAAYKLKIIVNALFYAWLPIFIIRPFAAIENSYLENGQLNQKNTEFVLQIHSVVCDIQNMSFGVRAINHISKMAWNRSDFSINIVIKRFGRCTHRYQFLTRTKYTL